MTPLQIELHKERLLKKVVFIESCWVWQGALHSNGKYGWDSFQGKGDSAHCVAWKLWKGEIPPLMHLAHSCERTHCINPAHLRIATPQENAMDKRTIRRPAFYITQEALLTIWKMRQAGASFTEIGDTVNLNSSTCGKAFRRMLKEGGPFASVPTSKPEQAISLVSPLHGPRVKRSASP